tara:strand:- start:7368 stop:7625 length:258 start_codon:yes stop_codon:yes gene_type:complete
MKWINSVFLLFISIVISLVLFYWLSGIDSAFEADQSCHALLKNYLDRSGDYGCDHDTETHQWILYEKQSESNPADIIKKFRYRFL